jgi:hypothetical protein
MPGASALLITSPSLADAARALLERWAPDARFVVWTPGDRAAAQALRQDLLRQRWSWGMSFYNDYLFNAAEIARFTDLFNIHPALPAIRGRGYDVLPLIERHGEYGVTLHRVDEAIDGGSILRTIVHPLPADCCRQRLRELNQAASLTLLAETLDQLQQHGPGQLAADAERSGWRWSGPCHRERTIDDRLALLAASQPRHPALCGWRGLRCPACSVTSGRHFSAGSRR